MRGISADDTVVQEECKKTGLSATYQRSLLPQTRHGSQSTILSGLPAKKITPYYSIRMGVCSRIHSNVAAAEEDASHFHHKRIEAEPGVTRVLLPMFVAVWYLETCIADWKAFGTGL
jgi:hypothetical protein